MSLRLLLFMQIVVLFSATVQSLSGDGYRAKRSDNGTDLDLIVGKEVMIPEVIEKSEKEQEKEANSTPLTDVIPAKESSDKQDHDRKGKNIETGMPPKYPLKAESAETSAHDNEIGGCRDHPRAGLVCSKCENGNKCFPAEHESYTYSYCRRSCRHCDPSTSSFHTFWRLRAQSEFEPTWMLQQVEFYADPQEKISLVDDPEKAYASSVYTGYKPSFAYDNNNGSAWYPSGWGNHDNNDDWIAYEFTVAVRVHGVRMVVDKDHATAQPKKVIVEASDKMYGPFQKKWTIYNNDFSVDKVYKLLECDVLWRRFEVEDGAWCFRLIAKLETWEGARKSCEIEGGDLGTISNKEEQRFVTDEVGLCSHTWFGLSHTNEGYYWNDGSNSTYRNWKDQLSYSDVQKQTLNCAAMDPDGVWFNFHCSNKFYFLCKKRLVPRPEPRPDLTDNAWPYPPEVPPLIFFAPNVTVPVINSKNLEPGIFPDANGKVEGEDQDEDITLSDLFYEQTVEHLKEKGLKPSEEIEADENQEETDFTQELNKIAINTSPGDFQNETKGDISTNNTAAAHKQEQDFENIPNKEANNAVTNAASADTPKPKIKHKEKPVPPPPEEGGNNGDDNSYPEIKHGKPVDDSLKNKSRHGKKVPKGISSPKEKNSFYASDPGQIPNMMSDPGQVPNMMSLNGDEQPEKAENIGQKNGDKPKHKHKPVHQNEENGDAGKQGQSGQSTTNSQNGMYFYVPNQQGSYTLMKTISPFNQNNQTATAGQQATPANASKQEVQSVDKVQPEKAAYIGKQNENKPRRKKKRPVHQNEENGDAGKQGQDKDSQQSSGSQNMYFYVPNSSGSYTLMKSISPMGQNNQTGNQATGGQQALAGGHKQGDTTEPARTPSSYMNIYPPGQNMQTLDHAHEQPEKAETIGKQDEEGEKENGEEKLEENPPASVQNSTLSQNASNPQQQGMYFYMPNNNGTMTLMRMLGDPTEKGNAAEPGRTPTSYMNMYPPGQNMQPPDLAHEQPEKAENIGKQDEEGEKDKGEDKKEENPVSVQNATSSQNSSNPQQQGMYFYVPNNNGTYTLMRTVYPWGAGAGAAQQQPPPPPTPNGDGKRPKPKEGDDDDDSEDNIKLDVKQRKHRKGESFKNKEIPMNPFTGPLGGPSLAQQNISKSARKKIKVLQPLESAAHGEDYSIMRESNKMKRKKAMSRHLIHTPKAKTAAKKRRRNRHLNHLKHMKEHDSIQSNVKVRHVTEHVTRKDTTHTSPSTAFAKEEEEDEEEDNEEPADIEESGSGSGTEVETDNADIFPEQEEFWSR